MLRQFRYLVFYLSILAFTPAVLFQTGCRAVFAPHDYHAENDRFRDEIIGFIRDVADSTFSGGTVQRRNDLALEGGWIVSVKLYYQGGITGSAVAEGNLLGSAIEEAALNALKGKNGEALERAVVDNSRFFASVTPLAGKTFSFIEYKGRGLELADDLVAVRYLDKTLVLKKIKEGKAYLLRSMNPEKYAFPKLYDAKKGIFEKKVRTIYTASSLFTLLKIQAVDGDQEIEKLIPRITDFIFSMQVREGKNTGAFHYSYDIKKDEKEQKFVVGTASKTIFTLLDLYNRTNDAKYLDSARLAGDWLLTMQRPDGSVIPHVQLVNGEWVYGEKFSCLYTGQVLSAFSRLYRATSDVRYYDAARKIAEFFIVKAREDGYYLQDEYRDATDAVPTTWAAMSLLDFYKASRDERCLDAVLKCLGRIIKKQFKNPEDTLNYGCFDGNSGTSGNGWINEVMVEFYRFANDEKAKGLEKYMGAITRVMRWLIQNTYSEENTYFLKKPAGAIGGLKRFHDVDQVRTDAVCHGLNGYIGILEYLGEGTLVALPEQRLPGLNRK